MSTGLPRPGLARSAHRGRIKFLSGYVSKSSAAVNRPTHDHAASLCRQAMEIRMSTCTCIIMHFANAIHYTSALCTHILNIMYNIISLCTNEVKNVNNICMYFAGVSF